MHKISESQSTCSCNKFNEIFGCQRRILVCSKRVVDCINTTQKVHAVRGLFSNSCNYKSANQIIKAPAPLIISTTQGLDTTGAFSCTPNASQIVLIQQTRCRGYALSDAFLFKFLQLKKSDAYLKQHMFKTTNMSRNVLIQHNKKKVTLT